MGRTTTGISIEAEILGKLDAFCAETFQSRSAVVQQAILRLLGGRQEVEPPRAQPEPGARKKDAGTNRSESRKFLSWAVGEAWEAHLRMRRHFFQGENGQAGPEPILDSGLKKEIEDAIRRKDGELVRGGDEKRFQRDSWARASGIGIFLDSWCTGRDPDNDASKGGKRYLECWRPWKIQRGKGDPIDRFAPLYFQSR
jgi:hypothetical protein